MHHLIAPVVFAVLAATATTTSAQTAPPKAPKAPKGPTVVKTGLPGLTPAKKEAAAAKVSAASGGATAPAVPYSLFRLKLQEAYCPTAGPEDKASVACKSFAISKKMRGLAADSEERKKLNEERAKLFQEAGKKSEEDKKAAGLKAKALYTKAYAKFCLGADSKHANEPTCTNGLMKKMYGPSKTTA